MPVLHSPPSMVIELLKLPLFYSNDMLYSTRTDIHTDQPDATQSRPALGAP